jgi:hypothetical protein
LPSLLLTALLISHALLDRRQFLQLIGGKDRFNPWRASLTNRQDLLLLLLKAHRVVIADGRNLFILVIHYGCNLLLLVWRELQLVVN